MFCVLWRWFLTERTKSHSVLKVSVEIKPGIHSVFSPPVLLSALLLFYNAFRGLAGVEQQRLCRWDCCLCWEQSASYYLLLLKIILGSVMVILGAHITEVTNLFLCCSWGFTMFLLKVFGLFQLTIPSAIFQTPLSKSWVIPLHSFLSVFPGKFTTLHLHSNLLLELQVEDCRNGCWPLLRGECC